MVRHTLLILFFFALTLHFAAAADYVLITLLHTNDLHGAIMPENAPGLAKAAALVRGIRTDMPNVILLDAGDMFHGTLEDYLTLGQATISAMNAAGYNAAAIGNHEFDYGIDVTRSVVKSASFPMISANLRNKTTGQSWDKVTPYVIINAGGVRIGILGLASLETISLHWPSEIEDVSVLDPISTAKLLIPELRQQVDVVVVLSHLGYKLDKELAAAIPGIDFIVGGHSHTTLDKWEWVGDTLITQAGAFARYLGRIDFIVAIDESGSKIASVNGKDGKTWNDQINKPLGKTYPTSPLIPVDVQTLDDEAVVSAYLPYREYANAVLDEVIGKAVEPVPNSTVASGESPAANLVADAIKMVTEADIALIDVRSVDSGLLPGPIRRRDAYDLMGGYTRQRLVTVQVKGSELISGLAERLLKDNKLRLQISGAEITFNQINGSKANIAALTIGGYPIDVNKEYTVAGQAYVIQGLMEIHPNLKVISDDFSTTREAISQYIESIKTVRSPETGRIKPIDR